MDLKIGEKVYLELRKEFGTVLKIEDEWTDWPHGSGTHYEAITIRLSNNEEIKVNTVFGSENIITKEWVEITITNLRNSIPKTIEKIENEIKDQEKLLNLF